MDIEVQQDLVSELERAHEGTGGVEFSKLTTKILPLSQAARTAARPAVDSCNILIRSLMVWRGACQDVCSESSWLRRAV